MEIFEIQKKTLSDINLNKNWGKKQAIICKYKSKLLFPYDKKNILYFQIYKTWTNTVYKYSEAHTLLKLFEYSGSHTLLKLSNLKKFTHIYKQIQVLFSIKILSQNQKMHEKVYWKEKLSKEFKEKTAVQAN